MDRTDTIRNRIEELINSENLSYTQFARKIGIQGTIVSHIINGRNKASLDVVQKILINFNYVSPEWLLFGNGEMYKNSIKPSENKEVTPYNNTNQLDFPTLFDNDSDNQSEYRKENELKTTLENQEKEADENAHPISSEKIDSIENRISTKENSVIVENKSKIKEENSKTENPPRKIKKIKTYEDFLDMRL